MAYVKSNTITALDLNTFLTTARSLYGTGTGTYGYGQTTVVQPSVATGTPVNSSAWVNLRTMMGVVASHQGTAITSLVPASVLEANDPITAHETDAPSSNPYDLRITMASLVTNRLACAAGNLTLTAALLTDTRSTTWSNNISSSYAATFPSEDATRHFFNSGSTIRLRLSQPTSGDAQGEVWRSIFENVLGTLTMTGQGCSISGTGTSFVTSKGYYTLTETYQNIFYGATLGGGAYASNELKIEAKVSGVVGLNEGNGAVISFRVSMVDTHSGGTDLIPIGTAVVFDVSRATDLSNIAQPTIVTINNLNASNENPIWLTASGSLGNQAVGDTISRQLVAVDPEGSALTFSRSGSLPPGLIMSESGLISGTITTIASNTTYNFDVLISDGVATPVSRSFSYYVLANRSPVWVTAAGQIAEIDGGDPVNFQLVATDADGDAIAFSLVGSSLPAGLSLSSTGLISGTATLPYEDTTSTFTVRISDGTAFADRTFSYKVNSLPATTVEFTANGTWTVPAGVNSVMFTWIVGGGGAGGTGSEVYNGGGGGGGGSGGFYHYQAVSCTPGDVFAFTIGQGGTDYYHTDVDPAATGTYVYKNSVQIFLAGPGGQGGDNVNTATTGGLGGSPAGINGQDAPQGLNDYASSYGAAGAPGPLQGAVGGAGGGILGGNQTTGDSAGKMGTGYGSGGGGGGSKDRTGTNEWAGGSGRAGYVQFIYPNKGATGGTPARV